MKSQKGDGSIVFVIILVAAAYVVGWIWSRAECHSKWAYSGMKTQWGIIKGCLVQVPDGRWLPEERIREIDIKPPEKKQ